MGQTSGYAILRMPSALVRDYDKSMRTHKAAEIFQALCDKLKPLQRETYRGISRFPLMPLPSNDPDILRTFEETGCDVKSEQAARRRFLQLLGNEVPENDFDEDLLPDITMARDVFSLLESPKDYEILHFAREQFVADADCLGFDIGYWGGDHYSIICDSAVRPRWHPPQPDCFDQLVRELRAVNESFLFPTADEAVHFRSWYRTQYWAELEFRPDEFCIIQVNKPRG